MIPSLNLENHFIILKKLSPPPSITKFWSKEACLDVLIDRIEHEYLFYCSNLVTYGCFLIFNSHKYHIWFKRDRAVWVPKLIDIDIFMTNMVNIRVIIIWNVNIFTIYETLFQNVINVSPIIYQNKTKIPGEICKCLVYQLCTSYLGKMFGVIV